jgi:hypothetical protein
MRCRFVRSQRVFQVCFLSMALCAGIAAQAVQTGLLHVRDLPTQAHVYVDERPVNVKNGVVMLPPGWHRVQVEAKLPKTGLAAYRRTVQIVADRTAEMLLVWHPVRLGINAWGGPYNAWPESRGTPGVPGPAGEPGPPARPYRPVSATDISVLRPPLQEARDILVDDFAARVQDTLNGLDYYAAPMYIYVPVHIYAPEGPGAEPPGPSGPIGPQGLPGIPAEVRLLQTQAGTLILDALAQRLGLPQMEQTLTGLQQRLQTLSETHIGRSVTPIPPFRVLTPEWKAPLDREWKRRKALKPPRGPGENFGIMGPIGAPGPRGPDGVVPQGTEQRRLSPVQETPLLDALAGDKAILEKVEKLKQQLVELAQRVYLAEGQNLETFPPQETLRTKQR